eukprot:TRINITY_DN36544_c0_g1_i1.p1 TRINITY_DN36544_c0_g1~~TRINITY_DN36544_c0_g1_i1.p1  ORF type:complete len:361 (+),score=69.63 TRINITY_DN36544_c0_g1_i1:68-1084(+)
MASSGMRTDKTGCTGGIVDNKSRCEKPRLWIFGVSYNSAKAHLALRISSAWPGTEIMMMDIVGTNYKPEYARLNPNMTVPTVEIDDKLITDSDILTEYLREKHPGVGDTKVAASGKVADMQKLIEQVKAWDEGLYTYGRMSGEKGGGMGAMSNKLRDLRLRQYCSKLLDPLEKLWDGATMQQTYEKKIAYIGLLSSKVDVGMTDEKKESIAKNEVVMEHIFNLASKLIDDAGGNSFLFGPDLTTADAYFAPFLFRIESMDKDELGSILARFPSLRGYWSRFKQTAEGKATVTKFTMKWAFRYSLFRCIPCSMIAMKLGCLVAPSLSIESEQRIKSMMS